MLPLEIAVLAADVEQYSAIALKDPSGKNDFFINANKRPWDSRLVKTSLTARMVSIIVPGGATANTITWPLAACPMSVFVKRSYLTVSLGFGSLAYTMPTLLLCLGLIYVAAQSSLEAFVSV